LSQKTQPSNGASNQRWVSAAQTIAHMFPSQALKGRCKTPMGKCSETHCAHVNAVSKYDIEKIKRYILNQEKHHENKK
jgi:hypothetical protein